jgi:hypothetical protein
MICLFDFFRILDAWQNARPISMAFSFSMTAKELTISLCECLDIAKYAYLKFDEL